MQLITCPKTCLVFNWTLYSQILFLADMISPQKSMKTKYGKNGPISSIFFNQWNINDELSGVLAGAANMALATNTWSNYTTVENHINTCSLKLNADLSFPWDREKTLKFIGYLKTDRNCAAKTIDCYLSAVRMSHLSRGIDSPHLRQPIVKMMKIPCNCPCLEIHKKENRQD